jgi:hypothetical protein
MFNPGLLLERPLKLKEGRTYLIVVPNYLGQGIRWYIATYYENVQQASFEDPSVMLDMFTPHWVVDDNWMNSIAHDNSIIPYKIPNAKEYEAQVDNFLGF